MTGEKKSGITAKERGLIRSALRRIWMWSEVREQVKARAKVGREYVCEMCGAKVKYNQIDIDHIEAVGSTPGSRLADDSVTWDTLINKLFCPPSNLRAICKACHAGITAEQKAAAAKKAKAKKAKKAKASKKKLKKKAKASDRRKRTSVTKKKTRRKKCN